jgi:hypothetical protein
MASQESSAEPEDNYILVVDLFRADVYKDSTILSVISKGPVFFFEYGYWRKQFVEPGARVMSDLRH